MRKENFRKVLRVINAAYRAMNFDVADNEANARKQEMNPCPLVIHVEPQTLTEEQEARERKREKRESINLSVQVCTLAAVCLYTIFTGLALYDSIHNSQITNRAYLSLGTIRDVQGGWGGFEIPLENYGHLPASYGVTVDFTRFLQDEHHVIVASKICCLP